MVQSSLSCSTAFSIRGIILLFTFFQFYSVVSRDSKVDNFALSFFFFLLIIISFDRLAEIRWSVFMSKSQRSLCVIFQDKCWVVHTSFDSMVKFKFLAHFPVDHLVASYLFFLWHDWSLWRYFVLLLKGIQFLS